MCAMQTSYHRKLADRRDTGTGNGGCFFKLYKLRAQYILQSSWILPKARDTLPHTGDGISWTASSDAGVVWMYGFVKKHGCGTIPNIPRDRLVHITDLMNMPTYSSTLFLCRLYSTSRRLVVVLSCRHLWYVYQWKKRTWCKCQQLMPHILP